MICFIYRSTLKSEMYLYTLTRDDFSAVPEQLLKAFGKAEFSMTINLRQRSKLARVDIEKVKQQLDEEGFYLQMPPTVLADHNQLDPGEST